MFLFVNLNQRPQSEFIMNKFRPKMPPFGVAYVASTLKMHGIESYLHDDNLHEYTDLQFRELFRKHKGKLQAVGLTSVSTTLKQLTRVSRMAKEELPDTPVIVGGPHARLLPDDIISESTVDIVFTGEAELAVTDFAKGKELSQINGIYFRSNGKTYKNPICDYIKNLDEIPFPDYELFDIADYNTTKGIAKRHPASYIITSRGCPYNCTFCSSKSLNPTENKRVRFRSPENVVEEIEYLNKKHGVRELFFSDDMFTGKTSHLFGVCEGIIKRKLDLVWVCQTHVNNITNDKLVIMKRAGCHQICFGVESGDPQIQKEINKNLDLDKVKNIVRMTQKAGIDARCSFMFGNQYETVETMQRTINFVKKIKPDFASFNIATPFPGTYLRAWAIENDYLASSNYEALDSTTYTLITKDLAPGTVEQFCNKAFRSFYYSPDYVFRRLIKIRDSEEFWRVLKSACYAISTIPALTKALFKKKGE